MVHDRGEPFSIDPQHANVYAPGKRPFHTIIPGFVMKDGKPWEAFGVMGGGMQPQGHVQVVTNQIDFGLNVQEAGDASRWQQDRKSTRLNSSHSQISYAVFCLKKKRKHNVHCVDTKTANRCIIITTNKIYTSHGVLFVSLATLFSKLHTISLQSTLRTLVEHLI